MAQESSVAPKERVNIRFKPATGNKEDVELPLKLMVLGDFTGRVDDCPIEDRELIDINKDNFNDIIKGKKLSLEILTENELDKSPEAGKLSVTLKFESLKDFEPERVALQISEVRALTELRVALIALKRLIGNAPNFRKAVQNLLEDDGARPRLPRAHQQAGASGMSDSMADASAHQNVGVTTTTTEPSLLDQVLLEAKITPGDEGYDLARRGVAAFLAELIKSGRADGKINNALIDQMIAEIDRKISAQLDAVLHTDKFQKLESAWRGLKFLVDRTDFHQNIKVELLSVGKNELLTDFEDSLEIVKSSLYKLVYTAKFGQFGGEPVAAIISAYEFANWSEDVRLMRYMSAVGAMSHSPVVASVGPKMFGVERHKEIVNLKDLQSIFTGPKYVKWNSFRESEDARYFGLTLPRFLLRLPYGPETIPVKSFNYQEASHGETDNYLWGNAAFAFATRLTESFAKYRWCPNIIGPQSGGAIEDLNLHTYESMGQLQSKVPTEVLISGRREFELAEQGFIALAMRKCLDNAAFFSANSVQKPKYFGNTQEGKAAELNHKLGTQLPYIFMINRFAHYIKVLQRENIGSWKSREELQSELSNWIRQYVSDQQNPSADVRSRRPLRKAEIAVEDVEGEPGWYRLGISIVPHFKYMGADFSLTLKGRLDKE